MADYIKTEGGYRDGTGRFISDAEMEERQREADEALQRHYDYSTKIEKLLASGNYKKRLIREGLEEIQISGSRGYEKDTLSIRECIVEGNGEKHPCFEVISNVLGGHVVYVKTGAGPYSIFESIEDAKIGLAFAEEIFSEEVSKDSREDPWMYPSVKEVSMATGDTISFEMWNKLPMEGVEIFESRQMVLDVTRINHLIDKEKESEALNENDFYIVIAADNDTGKKNQFFVCIKRIDMDEIHWYVDELICTWLDNLHVKEDDHTEGKKLTALKRKNYEHSVTPYECTQRESIDIIKALAEGQPWKYLTVKEG